MPIGHSPCIWHTELGCIAFPRIIRLQMISSKAVYKIVGDAKLHRQTGPGSSFMQSIPTDLLEHSSDAIGAAEVVAGVSVILALHHLQLVYVPTTSVGTCREEADAFANICSAAFFAISMQLSSFFVFPHGCLSLCSRSYSCLLPVLFCAGPFSPAFQLLFVSSFVEGRSIDLRLDVLSAVR